MKGYKEFFNDNMIHTPKILFSQMRHFPAHWHIQCEIMYITEGKLTVGINQHKKTIGENGIAIAASNCVHYYMEGEGSQIMSIFHPGLLGQNLWQKDVMLRMPILNGEEVPYEIRSLCQSMAQHLQSGANGLIQKGELIVLCGLIEDLLPFDSKPTVIPYADILSALDFIENNFTQDIHLNMLANYCNVSKYHFSRKFGAYTGMNLREYINTLRVNYCEEQLLTTDKAVAEIAYDSGFESLRSFNRAFIKISGKTPTDIRKT